MDHALVGGIINALPIEKMVSAPVMAAVRAQTEMSKGLADFIHEVGLDKNGNIRMVTFKYNDQSVDDTGKSVDHERYIQAPFMGFAVQGSLVAAFGAIFVMGIAESFGDAARCDYFTNLKAVGDLGEGKALGFFGTVVTLGKTLGPMAFGLAAVLETKEGVGLISIICLGAALLFMTITRREKGLNLNQKGLTET